MYKFLNDFNKKNKIYSDYTTVEMWNDPHISKQMLEFHLNPDLAMASRTKEFISDSANFIINKFNLDKNYSVIDFGCGPGLYTSLFAKTGAKITGVDVSKNSIDYAESVNKKNTLNINYITQNYLDFDTDEKFDLVTMIFCDFCVLNPDQRKQLLSIFHKVLKPNGKIIFDVFSEKFYNDMPFDTNYENNPEGGFWTTDPYHLFTKTFKYEDEKTLLLKYSVIEENQTRTFYNYLKSYNAELITNELSKNGFGNFELFGNVKGDEVSVESETICVVAEKK